MGYIPQLKGSKRSNMPVGTNRMIGTSVKPFRVSSAALRVIGAMMCILGTLIAAVLPVLSYIFVWHADGRSSIEAYTYWGIIGFACLLGLIALLSNSAFMLALHVILGAMLGAALAAHIEGIFNQQEMKCSMIQSAFAGCGNCGCAPTNTCTTQLLQQAIGCNTCQAYPVDFCNNFHSNRIIIGIIGAVTVFALAVPSVFSLLVLLRNEAARGIESTKLEWVRARVKEQCELLEAGQPLTFPLDALLGSVQRLEASGNEGNQALANRCKLDLAKQGFNVPAVPGTEEIQAGQAFTGAERAVVPDSNDAAAVPLQAWSSQRGPEQVVAPPKRSSTPTNVVYPVVTPSVPVNIPLYNSPVIPAPAAVTTVARETVVSETFAPADTVIEAEDGKERKHRHRHHKHRDSEEDVAQGEESGEKKRRHRKKREEEGADAV